MLKNRFILPFLALLMLASFSEAEVSGWFISELEKPFEERDAKEKLKDDIEVKTKQSWYKDFDDDTGFANLSVSQTVVLVQATQLLNGKLYSAVNVNTPPLFLLYCNWKIAC